MSDQDTDKTASTNQLIVTNELITEKYLTASVTCRQKFPFYSKKSKNSLQFTSIILVLFANFAAKELPARTEKNKIFVLRCREPRILHENFSFILKLSLTGGAVKKQMDPLMTSCVNQTLLIQSALPKRLIPSTQFFVAVDLNIDEAYLMKMSRLGPDLSASKRIRALQRVASIDRYQNLNSL